MEANFGEYIRGLRTQNNLTLTQLGAKLGIDSGALSKIETGKKEFDEACLPKLATAFNLDLETLKTELISEFCLVKDFSSKTVPEEIGTEPC